MKLELKLLVQSFTRIISGGDFDEALECKRAICWMKQFIDFSIEHIDLCIIKIFWGNWKTTLEPLQSSSTNNLIPFISCSLVMEVRLYEKAQAKTFFSEIFDFKNSYLRSTCGTSVSCDSLRKRNWYFNFKNGYYLPIF